MPLRRSALSVCHCGDPWGRLLQVETRHSWAPMKPPRGQTLRSPRPKVPSMLTRHLLAFGNIKVRSEHTHLKGSVSKPGRRDRLPNRWLQNEQLSEEVTFFANTFVRWLRTSPTQPSGINHIQSVWSQNRSSRINIQQTSTNLPRSGGVGGALRVVPI